MPEKEIENFIIYLNDLPDFDEINNLSCNNNSYINDDISKENNLFVKIMKILN